MRRGEAGDADAVRLAQAFCPADAGAFAVGAGDGDDVGGEAGRAHRLPDGTDPFQSQIPGFVMRGFLPREPFVQAAVHGFSAGSAAVSLLSATAAV